MAPPQKVLVLGDDTRSFLATSRSLGRAGLEVHAAPFNFRAPALKSRYISQIHHLPYYISDGREWLEAFEGLARDEGFALTIPCDERSLLPLYLHQQSLSALTRLAIPDARGLELFFDKNQTRETARSLGIPVADGRTLSADDSAEALAAEIGLPLAVKPAASYTADHLFSRNRVTIANDAATLAEALAEARQTPHIVEAFFPGQGVGVSVLANQGRILQAFEHHRVHELHGASYYRVSAEFTPQLLEAATKLVEAANYTGVAMLEFRVNRETGGWILLEVNARPWGSLPLPVALGVDFPYRWYQLLVEGLETAPQPYPAGIYGRNLVPDARYFLSQAKAARRQPARLARVLLGSLGEYLRVFVGREVHDVLVRDDPAPAFHEIGAQLRDTTTLLSKALPGSTQRARQRDQRALQAALRGNMAGGYDIAVVCQGNICRSPLAAALLQRELGKENSAIRVHSFGNLPRMGATSPTNAVTAAEALGIDLRPHRSQHFSRKAAEDADLVIAFDDTNERWIRDRYPALAAPIVMLGSFSSDTGASRVIADPDGGDLARFESTYRQISDAASNLAQRIRAICND